MIAKECSKVVFVVPYETVLAAAHWAWAMPLDQVFAVDAKVGEKAEPLPLRCLYRPHAPAAFARALLRLIHACLT